MPTQQRPNSPPPAPPDPATCCACVGRTLDVPQTLAALRSIDEHFAFGRQQSATSPWVALLHCHVAQLRPAFALLNTRELLDVVARLKGSGTLISLDPQHDAREQWTGEGGHLERLFPSLDVFLPNELEVQRVVGASSVEDAMQVLTRSHPQPWLTASLCFLLTTSGRNTIMTLFGTHFIVLLLL